jgi:ABC-type amino acid transport system permease subunit
MQAIFQKYFWVAAVFVIVSLPRFLFAQGNTGGNDPNTGSNIPGGLTNPLKAENLSDFVRDALTIVRDIGFLVAVFFIVYAGFLFVTARGDETKLTKAKGAFLWAVVGTAVLLGAWIFAEAIQGTVETLKA